MAQPTAVAAAVLASILLCVYMLAASHSAFRWAAGAAAAAGGGLDDGAHGSCMLHSNLPRPPARPQHARAVAHRRRRAAASAPVWGR